MPTPQLDRRDHKDAPRPVEHPLSEISKELVAVSSDYKVRISNGTIVVALALALGLVALRLDDSAA